MLQEGNRMAGPKHTLFKKGQSGNPTGRPKGSRNKLAEDLIGDMCAAWEKHGAAAIERMVAEEPATFVRTAVAILPKELHVRTEGLNSLSDAEFSQLVSAVRSYAANPGGEQGRAPPASQEQPDSVH
jgi:hypothetical protein